MNWLRAAAVSMLLLASGCGSGSSSTTGRPVHTQGQLVRIGGPAPGGAVALPGVHVHLQGRGGSADVRTDGQGRFAVDLAPGAYTVTIRSAGLPSVTVPHVIHIPHTGRLRLVVSVK